MECKFVMNYIYATVGANDVVDEFLDLLRNPYEVEDLEKFYFQISNYYLKIANEMMIYYMRQNNDWEFGQYQTNLQHETSAFGGTTINSIRNYVWYLRNDKKNLAEQQRKTLLHYLYLFIIGVQSTEILYYNIFKK